MHVLQSAGERGALRACHVPGLITVAVAGLGGTLGSIKLIFNDATSQTTPFASEQDPDYGEIFKPVEYAFDVGGDSDKYLCDVRSLWLPASALCRRPMHTIPD